VDPDRAPGAILLRSPLFPIDHLEGLAAPEAVAGLDRLIALDDALAESGARLTEALFRAAGPREKAMEPERYRARNAVLALRRAVHNRRGLDPAALAAARPLLATDLAAELERFDAHRAELRREREACAGRFREERTAAWAAFLRATRAPLFREGVWLAGRSLHQALEHLGGTDPRRWRSDEGHAASKLLAYLGRAVTKTSPNGVFCAVGLAGTGGRAPAVSGAAGPERVRTRLNVFEARKIASCLAADPALRALTRPRPNPTLRRKDGGWSFWRPASLREAHDDEVLSEVASHPVLDAAVKVAGEERPAWPRLLDRLSEASGAGREDVEKFLGLLIEKGILLAEIEIPTGEPRPLAFLARAVREGGLEPAWLAPLESIEAGVEALSGLEPEARVESMAAIGERVAALPRVRRLERDELFRTDAVSGFGVTVPGGMVEEVRRAVSLYVRILAASYPQPAGPPETAKFLAFHPPDSEVPLLDLYHGVFEPEERVRPTAFPPPAAASGGEERSRLGRIVEHLAGRARAAGAEDIREVRLDPAEFETLAPSVSRPWMAGALFQIAAPSVEAADGPGARLALNALFQGAGLALARFHDLLEPGLGREGRIGSTLTRGLAPLVPEGAIPAEITYAHWGRTANAGLRPRLYTHEIELPGETASPGAVAVPLADLLVRYDGARKRFVLRSRALGAEIVPVLSSGVQPEGIVSFLVGIGMQDVLPVAFFPGFDVPGITHWPRFAVGRAVLFRERWVFAPGEAPAAGRGLSEPAWFEAVHRWRRRHRLPRRVFVSSDRDPKPFHVDLESPLFVDLLGRALARGPDAEPPRLTVTEMLPEPSDLWLADGNGRYASEFLVQLAGGFPAERAVTGATPAATTRSSPAAHGELNS
jgi:hypothetical protein